ncbi:MAG: hypothetical protein ACFFCW_20760 [Candidatus Hodarchaeota archaeon]
MASEDKPYVGDIGTVIKIDMGENISAGSGFKFFIRKPGGTIIEKTAVLEGTQYLKYAVESGVFSEPGKYLVQPQVTLSGGTWKGTTANFTVYNQYN